MDRLWSPWRLEYVAGGEPTTGCIFCEATRDSESNSLIVFKGRTCYIILNLYPYNNGHVMVVPYRHLATFADLSIEELTEIGVLIQRTEAALIEAYQPHGFNIGVNLGAPWNTISSVGVAGGSGKAWWRGATPRVNWT